MAKTQARPIGWLLHFGMGLSWAIVQNWLLKHIRTQKEKAQIIGLGTFSGISGILIWKVVFEKHPHPPRTDFNRFYGHLLLAHMVYTLTVKAVLKPGTALPTPGVPKPNA